MNGAGKHRPSGRRLAQIRTTLVNWGTLLAVIVAVIGYRHIEAVRARAPLPPPPARLTSAQVEEWSSFPRYHDVVPVLLYHAIGGPKDYLSVPQPLFAAQMRALHLGHFHAIDIATYVRWVEEEMQLPPNPILITFDDGEISSFRGADSILAEYGFKATMFVVPAWVQTHPTWALQWDELRAMQASGRWDIQEHAGAGHTHVPIDDNGDQGEFYAYRRWIGRTASAPAHQETFAAYERRVRNDVLDGMSQLRAHIPGYRSLAFAVPYSNYGQRATNDERIASFFLSMLHQHFPVVFDGDYLDTGSGRPDEIKARFSPMLSYRIQQGPVMTADQLFCRLHAYVTHAPRSAEYACANHVTADEGQGPGG